MGDFAKGVDVASKSFKIINKNKIVLLYLFIPSFILYIPKMIIIIPLFFISALIFILLEIALTNHTKEISEQKETNIIKNLRFSFSKIKNASIWAIVWPIKFSIPILVDIALPSISTLQHLDLPMLIIVILLLICMLIIVTSFLIFSIITFFVTQIITLEKITILKAIKKSIAVIQNMILQIIGSIIWIALLTLPLLIFYAVFENYPHEKTTLMLFFVLFIKIIIMTFITTAWVIAKTLLYLRYKKKLSIDIKKGEHGAI